MRRRAGRGAVAVGVLAGALTAGTFAFGGEEAPVAPAVASGGTPSTPLASTAQTGPRYVSRPDLRPPQVTVHARTGDLAQGPILLAPKRRSTSAGTGALMVDDAGEPLWFRPNREGMRTNDLRVQRYKGKPVLTWWEGRAAGGHGFGYGVIADTSYRVIRRVRAKSPYRLDMHEFKLTPRGTALVIIYHTTRRDLRSVGGARNGKVIDGIIQEIDVETGKVLFHWHSLGKIALRESYRKVPESGGQAWDYFHPNSVDVDSDGNYIVSARYSYSVTKISRRTGRVIWRLGGKRSDFRMGRGTRFHLAHDAEWQPDGTLRVFDNSQKSIRDRSRVIWLDVDTRRKRVTLEREVRHPQPVLAATQANAESLPGGALFVGWGSQGRWSEFAADGTLRYDAELPTGYDSYRVYRDSWTGRPSEPPAVAARAQAGATAVYASWNGATDVVAWRVLAGPRPSSLAPIGDAPRQGFETVITVPGAHAYVKLQALDGSGQVLGTSRATRVSAG